ncbi:uncharacterized protein [Onthophagus taurus]|uniref:uncharacterized protein isoform X1 n=1 Tax=Onthophagus taurus TaxID=166361 RepID=UPI0039BE01E6
MAGYHPCSVSGCKDKKSSRHLFPNPTKQSERYHEWVKATGNLKLLTLDPNRVYRSYRVCHRHFTDSDRTTNMYLTKTCVPSLYLPEAIDSSISNEIDPLDTTLDEDDVPLSKKSRLSPLITSPSETLPLSINKPSSFEHIIIEHPISLASTFITEVKKEQDYSSSEEDEQNQIETISTDDLEKLIHYWDEFQSLAKKWHPNKTDVNKICNMVEDKCLSHFKEIIRKRQVQSGLGEYFSPS